MRIDQRMHTELAVKKDQPSTAKVVVNAAVLKQQRPRTKKAFGSSIPKSDRADDEESSPDGLSQTMMNNLFRIDGTVELWQRPIPRNNLRIPPSHGIKRVFDDPKAGQRRCSDPPVDTSLGLESLVPQRMIRSKPCACNAAGVGDPQPDPPRVGRSTILCLQAKGTNKFWY
jgi:hypothetical protein